MTFGLHEYLDGNSNYITFLRKPEDRIVSFYRYVLRRKQHRLYNEVKGNNMTINDFVTNIDQPDANNAQIRFISGIDDREELMLEKALENIDKHFSFVGLTERYNESLVLLKRLYQWPTPYYIVQNKSRNKDQNQNVKDETIELIKELNKGDDLLYQEMEKRFNAQIPDHDRKFNLEMSKLNTFKQLFSSRIALQLYSTVKDTGIGKQIKKVIRK